MKLAGAKKQTFFLTGINGVVRALGLMMRVMLSRRLGAEIMGIMELAQSVHMVAITPLTSGLPAAVSRLTARAQGNQKADALYSGLRLVRICSAVLIPFLWLLSAPISLLMGDVRVLPSLWFTAPCILILGYSAVYNGYCYGNNMSTLPAMSELIEQITRFLITFLLLHTLHGLTSAWAAAIPTAATMVAELLGLIFVLGMLKLPTQRSTVANCRPVFYLAVPTTVSRIVQTLLRSLTAILIPLQLQRSGLCEAEATAQLGMYNGMVCPILMLPGIFTSALSMVTLPRIAKAEEQPAELKRLLLLSFAACIPFSLLCCAAIWGAAPMLSTVVFRQPEIRTLFEQCAPMTLLMSLSHLTGSVLSALGQQKRSLYISCAVSLVTLFLTWLWAGNPALRITGVIHAQYAGFILSIFLSAAAFCLWKRERGTTPGGKSA